MLITTLSLCYRSNTSAGSVAPIPTHTPYDSSSFTPERPARICYHGIPSLLLLCILLYLI